jgi:Holliday junction resolvasome RuvABC DNA-binding subunit
MECKRMDAQHDELQQQQSGQPNATAAGPSATAATKVANSPAPTNQLLALSSLGVTYGSLRTVVNKIKRATSLGSLKLPKLIRTMPKYMRNNYVKYPLLFVVFLAATRRLRAALNH